MLTKLELSLVWLGASLVGALGGRGTVRLVKYLTLLGVDEILVEDVLELLVKEHLVRDRFNDLVVGGSGLSRDGLLSISGQSSYLERVLNYFQDGMEDAAMIIGRDGKV